MTRYEWFRKRLAPVALILALVLLAHETCNRQQAASETIELRFGSHAAEVQHVRADVLVGDQPVGYVERDLTADPTTPVRFPAVIDGDNASISIDLRTTRGPRHVTRALTPGDVVIVDLGPDLDR